MISRILIYRQLLLFLFCLSQLRLTLTGPVAPPVVIFASRGEEVVLRLAGHNPSGRALATTLVTLPGTSSSSTSPPTATAAGNSLSSGSGVGGSSGALHELSQLFITQGLQPRRGKIISETPYVVPQSAGNRILYVVSSSGTAVPPNGAWSNFTYRVADGPLSSAIGTVWVIPPHRKLVSSDFRADMDGWKIAGSATLSRETFSRGLLAQYLVGTDTRVATSPRTTGDGNLWHFVAPSQFLGNKVAAYGGALTFTAGAFAGDFTVAQMHVGGIPLVILECASCGGGGSGGGIRLGYFPPTSSASASSISPATASATTLASGTTTITLDGKTKKFSIPLISSSWLRDPRNSLSPKWLPITDCELVSVLQSLSGLKILGDWTRWYETVAIDDITLLVSQPWQGIPKSCY